MPTNAVSLVLLASLTWPSFVRDDRGSRTIRRPDPPDAGLRVSAIVDLSRISKEIRREPEYRTDRQTYVLLVFGLWAERRVWIVQDGKDLYVDLDADGDLTGPGERFNGRFDPLRETYFWKLPNPLAPGGTFDHRMYDVSIRQKFDRATIRASIGDHPVFLYRNRDGESAKRVIMAGSPAEATVLRFDGPLSMAALIEEAADRPSTFKIRLLFESLGHGKSHYDPDYTFRVIKALQIDGEDGPGPLVTIRFPKRDGGAWTFSERFDLRRTHPPPGFSYRLPSLTVTPPQGLDLAGVARVTIAPPPGSEWLLGRPLVFTVPINELAEFAEAPARSSELEFRRRPGSGAIERRTTYRRRYW